MEFVSKAANFSYYLEDRCDQQRHSLDTPKAGKQTLNVKPQNEITFHQRSINSFSDKKVLVEQRGGCPSLASERLRFTFQLCHFLAM